MDGQARPRAGGRAFDAPPDVRAGRLRSVRLDRAGKGCRGSPYRVPRAPGGGGGSSEPLWASFRDGAAQDGPAGPSRLADRLQSRIFTLSVENAEGQSRTVDTWIFSPLLYRLSYLGNRAWKSLSKLGMLARIVNRNTPCETKSRLNVNGRFDRGCPVRHIREVQRGLSGPVKTGDSTGAAGSGLSGPDEPGRPPALAASESRQRKPPASFGYLPSTVLSSKCSMNSI